MNKFENIFIVEEKLCSERKKSPDTLLNTPFISLLIYLKDYNKN